MKHRNVLTMTWCIGLIAVLSAGPLHAQHDPGPRGGPAGAGGPYPTLSDAEKSFFGDAMMTFMEVDSVSGTIEEGEGLGPTYNGNSCAMCHAQPAIGGSSPGLKSLQNPVPNPQVALANLDGASNTVPSFITADGPVREARFIRNYDGSLDGGVHGLFTIAGRTDAPGCTLAQPNFAGHLAAHNVVFRTPTPLFGLGLVENTPDATLQANLAANHAVKARLGIRGRFNTSGNDGTITRFGWKAQNKSLMLFAAEAYNVEQGVANEVFSNERNAVPGCVFNDTPEDGTDVGASSGAVAEVSSDIVSQAAFARLSAPPTPAPMSASAQNGAKLFDSVGCVLCHSSSLTTGAAPYTGMSNVTYHPYSDFALHHMGSTLADGVNQGVAGPDEFRTTPLWGIGQRLFFLHDGRTSDLLQAIEDHASPRGCGGNLRWSRFRYSNCGSEANGVIHRFHALSPTEKQSILDFLRSL
jgi:cytochrome c5